MEKPDNTRSFEQFFKQYKNLVYKTAYSVLGDGKASEDIMQEVFIKVYKSGGYLRPEKGRFESWLHRLTVNQCISGNRKKRLASRSFEILLDEGIQIPDSNSDSTEELMIKKEKRQAVQQALQSIDEDHRAILSLRFYKGLAYGEIADMLNIPLGTVKSRIHNAIKTLHSKLRGKLQE